VVTESPGEKNVAVTAMELVLARLLRIGSIIAAALLGVGILAMELGQTELAAGVFFRRGA